MYIFQQNSFCQSMQSSLDEIYLLKFALNEISLEVAVYVQENSRMANITT